MARRSLAGHFQRHGATEGLGPLGNVRSKDQGLWLHSTLAFSAGGHCLGFVHAQCWARDPANTGQRHQRYQRAAQDKESHRWVSSLQKIAPQTVAQAAGQTLIRIADREADLWEVLAGTRRHLQAGENLHVLTRSHDRKVEVLSAEPAAQAGKPPTQGAKPVARAQPGQPGAESNPVPARAQCTTGQSRRRRA